MAVKYSLPPGTTPPSPPPKGGEVLPPYNPKPGSDAYKRYMSEAKAAQTVAEKVATDPEGKERIDLAVHRLIAQGKVNPQPARDLKTEPVKDRSNPDLIEEFSKLLLVGANAFTIRSILQLTHTEYEDLHKAATEAMIRELSNTGILGTVALSFSTLQEASRRALQALASIGEGKDERDDLLSTIQVVTQVEKAKIDLLIRTGAVKVKKQVELTARFETPTSHGNIDTFNSEKARTVMVQVASALAEGLAASEDAEIVDETSSPQPDPQDKTAL